MEKVNYVIVEVLKTAGAVDQEEDRPAGGLLLVGDEVLFEDETGHNGKGCNITTIQPAIFEGKRSWLRADNWCPAEGYSACGYNESIISFSDGALFLLEKGAFSSLWGGQQLNK